MTYECYSAPGRYHLELDVPNEDRVLVSYRDSLTAAAVCDGAGSFGFGAQAAEVMCQTVTALLLTEFDALYRASCQQMRERLATAAENALRDYARCHQIPEQELACTVLAAAVHADGRCLCVHLGDGIILQKNKGDHRLSVVSCPMTGLAPHSTYLTMNCDLRHYLRIYRWETKSLEQLLLLSDGAAEHLVRLQGGDGWVYTAEGADLHTIRTRLRTSNPRDDHSAVLLTRQ